jgi:hypothetical protein
MALRGRRQKRWWARLIGMTAGKRGLIRPGQLMTSLSGRWRCLDISRRWPLLPTLLVGLVFGMELDLSTGSSCDSITDLTFPLLLLVLLIHYVLSIMYLSPALKFVLKKEYYDHWMLFVSGCRLVYRTEVPYEDTRIALKLFHKFILLTADL